ncbi:MAG TPA: DoxX family protein [Planctomycetota bacterium]|nr:DoxX family protein [Planctomycetota bacterium]
MTDAPSGLRRLDESGLPLLLARLVVGGAFISLGALKLRDPVAFLKALREYDMFPVAHPWLMNATAAALPGAEITCGLLLLAGVAVRGTALFLLAMLLVFTTAIAARASAVAHEKSLALCAVAFDCGCGAGVQNACRKLAENTGLILLCLLALASRSRRWCWRGALLRRGPAS